MHQAEKYIAGLHILDLNPIFGPIQERGIPGPVSLGQHARRLVHSQKMVVLIQDLDLVFESSHGQDASRIGEKCLIFFRGNIQMSPNLSSMIRIFERSGFDLKAVQYRLLWQFHQRIREKNDSLDLTRIRNFENMVVKHYVDSAYVTKLIRLPSPLLDIGTGAGFPGVPIKILDPRIVVILAEGRKKRAAFLEEVCALLKLDGAEVYPHKIPGRFDRRIGGVITRAFEVIPRTLERVYPLLSENGKAIFMKGPNCQEEVDGALNLWKQAFELEKDLSYALPGTPHKRRLLVFRKKRHVSAPGVCIESNSAGTEGVHRAAAGPLKEIVGPNNPTFRGFLKLLKARGIRKQGLALLSGEKQVGEALEMFTEKCAGILYSDPDTIAGLPQAMYMPRYRLHPDLFSQLDVHQTGRAVLLIKAAPFQKWRDENWPPGCTLFVPFQDPRNVGAVIRSAAAFGVSRIVVLKEAAHPYHHASLRAAGSTIFRTEILGGPSLHQLRVTGVPMITLSPHGGDLGSYRFPESFCLVPGIEGPGLPGNLKGAASLSVPMMQGVESLNAAMATGIVLYIWSRKSHRFA